MTLFQRHDLEIFNVEKLSIHGGTLRLFVGHNGQHDISDDIEKILYQEESLQLYNSASYQKFMKQLQKLKENLITLLQSVKSQGKQIAAYGASAKGTTLLNYFGIGTDFLNFVVDRSAAKQGKLTPGTQLEILAPPEMLEADYAILLAWNFADEIIQQQKDFINKGGKFIVPLPEVKILP